ncbi:MAG: SpoIIE family protein phosphatase [Desulfovibrionales bacterium]|nr:SpoIIE family protein phosphatase [Desulfovibrionales bacterium]
MKDRTPKILIVDDEPLNIKILEMLLNKHGFQTISANNGASARIVAAQELPDLILLDVMMPDEDGYATCEHLKRQPGVADIPVIFISALTDTASKVHGLDVGGVDYISKPFERAEVLARVKVHLKLRFTYQALIEAQAQRLAQVQDAQQSLLVSPEDIPQAGFAVHYEPILEAGGDFYDVLSMGGAVFDYIVADVSGHDLGTSYITSALKALFSQNCNPVTTASESLSMINRVLCRILENDTHITAGFARLNRSQNTLEYVNAGHPAPLLVRASGDYEILHASGDILGAFDSVVFDVLSIPVSPGDRLFLYTDGLIENFGPTRRTRDQGLQYLAQICQKFHHLPLPEALTAIHTTVAPPNVPREDDIILLAVEV